MASADNLFVGVERKARQGEVFRANRLQSWGTRTVKSDHSHAAVVPNESEFGAARRPRDGLDPSVGRVEFSQQLPEGLRGRERASVGTGIDVRDEGCLTREVRKKEEEWWNDGGALNEREGPTCHPAQSTLPASL